MLRFFLFAVGEEQSEALFYQLAFFVEKKNVFLSEFAAGAFSFIPFSYNSRTKEIYTPFQSSGGV